MMIRQIFVALGLAATMTLLSSSCLLAADIAPTEVPPSQNTWKYQVTLYGWAAGINGDVGIRGLPTASVDVTPWDAIRHLDGALSGSFAASDGTWLFFSDLMWVKLSAGTSIGGLGGKVNFDESQTLATALVGHSLPFGDPNLELYLTAGARYQHYRAKLSIDPALFPGTSHEATKDWVDPIVGVSLHYDFNDRWFVNAMADVGGFGVGSKFTSQGFASVGYNWTKTISTALGYRVLYTDYDKDGFKYNTTQHGIFSSVAFHF